MVLLLLLLLLLLDSYMRPLFLDALPQWLELCDRFDVRVSDRRSLSHVIDKLVGRFIEPNCIQPTFLIDHPLSMSPLAKPHRNLVCIANRSSGFRMRQQLMTEYRNSLVYRRDSSCSLEQRNMSMPTLS
jgi:lysyl-tRNA synthetase class II